MVQTQVENKTFRQIHQHGLEVICDMINTKVTNNKKRISFNEVHSTYINILVEKNLEIYKVRASKYPLKTLESKILRKYFNTICLDKSNKTGIFFSPEVEVTLLASIMNIAIYHQK